MYISCIRLQLIHFLQLRRFLRSLDGSTNTGGSPMRFTLSPVDSSLVEFELLKR